MGKAKGSLLLRQKSALKRLEVAYKTFKAAGEDKKPQSSTRNGRVIYHSGRSYNEECERMKKEIANVKANISKNHL